MINSASHEKIKSSLSHAYVYEHILNEGAQLKCFIEYFDRNGYSVDTKEVFRLMIESLKYYCGERADSNECKPSVPLNPDEIKQALVSIYLGKRIQNDEEYSEDSVQEFLEINGHSVDQNETRILMDSALIYLHTRGMAAVRKANLRDVIEPSGTIGEIPPMPG